MLTASLVESQNELFADLLLHVNLLAQLHSWVSLCNPFRSHLDFDLHLPRSRRTIGVATVVILLLLSSHVWRGASVTAMGLLLRLISILPPREFPLPVELSMLASRGIAPRSWNSSARRGHCGCGIIPSLMWTHHSTREVSLGKADAAAALASWRGRRGRPFSPRWGIASGVHETADWMCGSGKRRGTQTQAGVGSDAEEGLGEGGIEQDVV